VLRKLVFRGARVLAAALVLAAPLGVGRVDAAALATPLYRPIRHLSVPENGGHFGAALATVGTRLLVGAPNLGTAGSTNAYAYLFDPATGALVHDLRVEVGADRWWQFSVAAVGADPVVAIAPGDEADGLGGIVTVFDGEAGGTLQTICCPGGIAIGVGDDVLVGGAGGGSLYDPATGNLVRTYTIPDPNRRGVQSLALLGRTTILIAAAQPVGIHMFDVRTAKEVGFVGTRHGDARRFGSAMAVNGGVLAVTEIPQVNFFDLGFGLVLGTIDPPPGLGGASFGTALAYADGVLAVGAPSGGDVGAVHLYDANGKLVESLPAAGLGGGFGRAVAGLGRSVAVGAPTDDGGEVVIFAPCGDGTVDAPVEQCDDGNDDDSDGCDAQCRVVTGGATDDCGDVDGNGTRSVSDAVQILRAAARLESACTLARCDVDGNGVVGVTDGVQILRAAAALPFVGDCTDRNAVE
jgi:cysteine-rich repeat protein